MTTRYSPQLVTNGLLTCIDSMNVKSYSGTGSQWNDLTGNGQNFILNSSSGSVYYSFDTSSYSIKFSRNMPPLSKAGAYAQLIPTGSLEVTSYLYNNHTTEVWAKINNINSTGKDATENGNALLVYVGCHAMFQYFSGNLRYQIWSGSVGPVNAPFITVGTSGTDIIQGRWFQAVVVRNGNNLSSYVQGVLKSTTAISPPGTSSLCTTNVLRIAQGSNTGSSYTWNSDCNVSMVRMYNRALSATEVLQNFNATRNRFGI